ncbi:hypothetical protein [Magnetovibrio blakemorei]|uniref:Uncharacterized protein n=1 Tax=Magnetovibrio blakemorei TaxID=28181 RepID=A0A1E5Q2X7_9PROT|nr:hypothetical protein [Magnetovibrio blakemorei]OEJ63798.1 hypothetical protein BEN30_17325 [Magnetovibrio blakemorei]
MSALLILTASGFLAGFFWGFKKPANYCHLGTAGAQAFGNRFGSGMINGVIVGALVGIVSYVAFG